MSIKKNSLYKEAGVDIDLAQKLLGKVKKKISSTKRPEVLAPIGGFGGLFSIDLSKYSQPVMVSSVDGVGTKLMIAGMMEKYDTVGVDIVNHCIDDIAVQGAEPVYFMDYLGIGKLRSPLYEQVLEGIADACLKQNVSILGGETAEMPGMYGDDFDLVGCITGIVEKDELITGEKIQSGYKMIALPSSGLHTNGYSLARKVLFEKGELNVHSEVEGFDETVGEALLKPHTCYWSAIKKALDADIPLDGMAHITGGGLYDNVPRILPKNLDAVFDTSGVNIPPIFSLIEKLGDIDKREMHRVFNMGIGMVWFVPQAFAESAISICKSEGFDACLCGETVKGTGEVIVNSMK
ncbi:MAG: phosphoribosylformylglycinamidine cyclo-ligase [Verrucomicrobiota bacterium]|nr:phosphoribosylformylglycinamidine cyclo-ligase [Verrucomicrobiota bacterium]